MNAGAAVFMTLSWIGVLLLTGFCFWKVMTTDDEGNRKSGPGSR